MDHIERRADGADTVIPGGVQSAATPRVNSAAPAPVFHYTMNTWNGWKRDHMYVLELLTRLSTLSVSVSAATTSWHRHRRDNCCPLKDYNTV